MKYQVEITPAADKQIRKLAPDLQQLVIGRLEQLANEPRPDGVVKLKG